MCNWHRKRIIGRRVYPVCLHMCKGARNLSTGEWEIGFYRSAGVDEIFKLGRNGCEGAARLRQLALTSHVLDPSRASEVNKTLSRYCIPDLSETCILPWKLRTADLRERPELELHQRRTLRDSLQALHQKKRYSSSEPLKRSLAARNSCEQSSRITYDYN